MKVVHICKLPDGGATWCAMRISAALNDSDVESSMLLMNGEEVDGIAVAEKDAIYKKHDNVLVRMLMKAVKFMVRPRFEYLKYLRRKAEASGKVFFTSPVTEYTCLTEHPAIKAADIVHLHWVSDFVDFPSFFKKIDKPVVWTIHDENPGLGGFHYVSAKQNAGDAYLKLDKIYAGIKKKAVNSGKTPHLVAISSEMRDFFLSNEILRNCPVTLIHNGVEGKLYKMLDKEECREKLGIPLKKKVFLFSSFAIEDKRKGLSLLIEALERLNDSSVMLICLGGYNEIPKSSIEIRCVGLVSDKDLLSRYYSAADYFVLSSFQEGFAQTPLEAMACGTPVVAFPCSGASEQINTVTGVVCEDFTVNALQAGIRQAMGTAYSSGTIRADVLRRFDYGIIAKQYIRLYKEILKS
ncbi:glycosyltransferase [Palleniella muris]|uniref:Glycosyltransferase n=1 Tax=Palleniella muris TaxID=3038145 RepID=A0AC61QRM1_9BACT|nr:glycosyltransferase [Palleniella muris]TGX82349.1 glycosyltransferase [Palleniella muris]